MTVRQSRREPDEVVEAIFDGSSSPFTVGRYHSLMARRLQSPIRSIAWCGQVVMAIRHDEHPLVWVQFHPGSILAPEVGV